MKRQKIRIGLIGLGLMGREFASSVSRWCSLLSECSKPVITGICDKNKDVWKWYTDNFPDIRLQTDNYKELLKSDEIDAIYCAVPHNLHEQFYIDIINAKKHLLGEKPFGIDKKANANILVAVKANPDVIVRCSSEFPYFPACQQMSGAFVHELSVNESDHPFKNVTPEETRWSHELLTAAMESHSTGERIVLAL